MMHIYALLGWKLHICRAQPFFDDGSPLPSDISNLRATLQACLCTHASSHWFLNVAYGSLC